MSSKKEALDYHSKPFPGKITLKESKPLRHIDDLSLAYSPGAGAAVEAIMQDPARVNDLTLRGNLVGVISNGTAVLGLGNTGALASKPVMEGKALLLKKFAGINAFDLEIQEKDPKKLVEIIASLEPTFGGINLEDIKSPECFYVEQELKKKLGIPVFHDDQHGTAIVVAAAVLNALYVTNKRIQDIKCVTLGAGAAALACLDLLVACGMRRENIFVCDSQGLITESRQTDLTPEKQRYMQNIPHATLDNVMKDADMFLGLSPGVQLAPELLKFMTSQPLVFALANPVPEIMPQEALNIRPDAIIATGRSDFPNQVNNVLCFPYIFRGALDAGASCINQEMKIACVHALAELSRQKATEITLPGGRPLPDFSSRSLVPHPFDHRLLLTLPYAVAQAALKTGVGTQSLPDIETYRVHLEACLER